MLVLAWLQLVAFYSFCVIGFTASVPTFFSLTFSPWNVVFQVNIAPPSNVIRLYIYILRFIPADCWFQMRTSIQGLRVGAAVVESRKTGSQSCAVYKPALQPLWWKRVRIVISHTVWCIWGAVTRTFVLYVSDKRLLLAVVPSHTFWAAPTYKKMKWGERQWEYVAMLGLTYRCVKSIMY